MNKKQIKDLALSNGFKLKEQPSGKMDLNPYVYHFADALLEKANDRVEELERSVDKANEMLEEVRASGDLGLYMDNKLTAFLVGDSEQLRKEQE